MPGIYFQIGLLACEWLPGLIAGQVDAVALHPEDVFSARKRKPGLHPRVQLADLMPNYMFNAYGASTEWIARDRELLRDTIAAMIEANRTIYRERDKVVPIMMEATRKPSVDQVANVKLAEEALQAAGGRVTIGKCTE